MTETTTKPQLLCGYGSCGRPAAPETKDPPMCAEHRDLWDASSEHEEWRMALDVLRPWVESARYIHFEVLTELIEEALSKGEEGLERTRRELEEARAAAKK